MEDALLEYQVRTLMRRQLSSDFSALSALVRATTKQDVHTASRLTRMLMAFPLVAVFGAFKDGELMVAMSASIEVSPWGVTIRLYELQPEVPVVLPLTVREALENRCVSDVRSKCYLSDIAGDVVTVVHGSPDDFKTFTLRPAAE